MRHALAAVLASFWLVAGAAAQSGTSPKAPSAGVRQPAGLVQADREFMRQAARNAVAEIEASQLAQSKATRGDVKAFAGKMIEDHSRSNEQLEQLAAAKKISLPMQPSVPQRSALNTLQAVEGERFDRAYTKHFGVKATQDTLELFRHAADKARDGDVKAFAQKVLPALREHLAMAKALQDALDPKAAGRRDGGTVSSKGSSAVDASATAAGGAPKR